MQGHISKQMTDRPFLVMGNRFVNGGKRMIKWQTGNSKALSNFYHWKDASGPLGGRSMAEGIASFTSNNIARNNHLKYSAAGGLPKTMFTMIGGSIVPRGENNHFDCNLVEFDVDTPTSSTSTVLVGVNGKTSALTGLEFKNSTFTHNVIVGPGRPLYNYWFREGWDDLGTAFIHNPNSGGINGQRGVYKP